jgi:hypothetical protein
MRALNIISAPSFHRLVARCNAIFARTKELAAIEAHESAVAAVLTNPVYIKPVSVEPAPKEWTIAEIRSLLERSDQAVEKAIMRLWSLQTHDEQVDVTTKHLNGKGFSSAHASNGAYYASWINSGRHLSGKHLEKARKICLHYARQLTDCANRVIV